MNDDMGAAAHARMANGFAEHEAETAGQRSDRLTAEGFRWSAEDELLLADAAKGAVLEPTLRMRLGLYQQHRRLAERAGLLEAARRAAGLFDSVRD